MSTTTETSAPRGRADPLVEVGGPGVDTVPRLTSPEFAEGYVTKNRPVLIKRALADTTAFATWTFDHLRQHSGDKTVLLKDWSSNGEILTRQAAVAAYLDEIAEYEGRQAAGYNDARRPAYLHDAPLTGLFPAAALDLAAFSPGFFPSWYGRKWTDFAQFFLGQSGSYTPLDFDCLLTQIFSSSCVAENVLPSWILISATIVTFTIGGRRSIPSRLISTNIRYIDMRGRSRSSLSPASSCRRGCCITCAASTPPFHSGLTGTLKAGAVRGVLALPQGMPLKNRLQRAPRIRTLDRRASRSDFPILPNLP